MKRAEKLVFSNTPSLLLSFAVRRHHFWAFWWREGRVPKSLFWSNPPSLLLSFAVPKDMFWSNTLSLLLRFVVGHSVPISYKLDRFQTRGLQGQILEPSAVW